MGEHDEQFIFEMGYNKGFKDGIKGSIPKAEVKKFLEEGAKNISNNVLAIVREDYIHKADYESRLKADMVTIFDKIRAEIEEIPIAFTSSFEMKQDCLDILDKYKAEIEPQESEGNNGFN